MNPFELMASALEEKVSKVNVNNPKANSGAVLLKLSKVENFEGLLGIAFQIIQMSFTKDSSSDPAGTGKLTQISSLIGYKIGDEIGRGILPWRNQVRLGDLFIEAYKKAGYIDMYFVPRKDKEKAHYVIAATAKWIDLADLPQSIARVNMIGTSLTPPPDGCPIKVSVMPEDMDEPYVHPIGVADERYKDTVWWRSVTKLQKVPWHINRRVYEALRASKDMFVSDTPVLDNDAKEQKRRSKQVEWGFIISKADYILEELKGKPFYQNMEADYRGRLYYCEPFLNFQGSDLSRGMLKFARGKPMTEEGKWWLAVHTASSFNQSYDIDEIPEWCEADYHSHLKSEGLESISVDKFTLEDRVRWTNENMQVIIQAGREHLFAEDAEKKVSFLACCIEWADIEDAEKDRRIHMSSLPIPIDGSNNGWQHLGAISKDPRTGELVGLVAQEIQRDFYVTTAKQLLEIDDEKLNAMPMKHIRKGISKRGSMTRAYSAGAGKIAENMWFDVKTEDFHEKYDIDEKDCKRWSNELIKAINVVCPGPLETMEYMQKLASYEIGTYKKFKDGEPAGKEYYEIQKKLSALWSEEEKDLEAINDLVKEAQTYKSQLVYGNGSDRITWTTPSGFPVTYTNFRMDSFKERGTIDGKQIKHVAQLPTKIPDMRGFMCGISPNMIHSLDASHMAGVIDQWNGDFGAVHDSFATHASDVDTLLDKTKHVFVEMYNVTNFYDYIESQVLTQKKDCFDVEQPRKGDLDIMGIYESDYFFA